MTSSLPDLSFTDEYKQASRALPTGWWIGTTQFERADGTLEVIDHSVPIRSAHTPPVEANDSFTGRRLVKLWAVGEEELLKVRPPMEAPQSALPPGAAKARQVDHLRYEKGSRKAVADPLPPEHYATHEPADARCPICEAAHQSRGW